MHHPLTLLFTGLFAFAPTVVVGRRTASTRIAMVAFVGLLVGYTAGVSAERPVVLLEGM